MSISDINGFEHLCEINGIVPSYYDIGGQQHTASFESKQKLLGAMNISVANNEDVHQAIQRIEQNHWQSVLPPLLFYSENQQGFQFRLTLNAEQKVKTISWVLTQENGKQESGSWNFEHHPVVAEQWINGQQLFQLEAYIQETLALGYHQLEITLADGHQEQSQCIVTPSSCYQTEALEQGKKLWGVGIQLYTLRSERNWGIGDFTDLKAVIDILAPLGVDMVGLNPLHALFSHLPENASPYSPSSRDFLNPMYLDIENIAEIEHCEAAKDKLKDKQFQDKLATLRDMALVDYASVKAIKMEFLDDLFRTFKHLESQPEFAQHVSLFTDFKQQGGDSLYHFAVFEALQADFYQRDNNLTSWQLWPKAYQNPNSDEVLFWIKNNQQAIEFYMYIQWLVSIQLKQVENQCTAKAMHIGLYNDLAVGNARDSATCWFQQSLYATGLSIGAPPDDLSLQGQDWGLPPQLPQQLTRQKYQPFIETLRANMTYAGAIRIDHVMGLMRLYIIAEGDSAVEGVYVRYPFDDLLRIVALESQRNQCLVIGEDLGTVTDEVRQGLTNYQIMSYRVMLFEKDWHNNQFTQPKDYLTNGLCTSGSHDLPTFKAFWSGEDLTLRDDLNLFDSESIKQQQYAAREKDRYFLIKALVEEGLLDQNNLNDQQLMQLDADDLFLPLQKYLARSRSKLMLVQLEDLFSQSAQINVPGTVEEYPNWRHKIELPIEHWQDNSQIQEKVSTISHERLL